MRKKIKDNPNKGLFFLYNTAAGRIFLTPFVKNVFVSKIVGKFMDMKISKLMIKPFIKNHNINMGEYEKKEYMCFNDFFIRNVKHGLRPFSNLKKDFIAPCDSKLTVYKINDDLTFNVKNSTYSVNSIIKDKETSILFENGYALVFRLAPDDYHHYVFCDDGIIVNYYKVPGIFHTVNPIVYDKYKVFKENVRECSLIETKNFGTMMYVEVGALLVGKINNLKITGKHKKGEEKGYFMYGGSTVVLLTQENKFKIDEEIITNSNEGFETIVKCGEKIGEKLV